jgi:sulfur-carrier protein adenylyltransferase/sulfurtransferase
MPYPLSGDALVRYSRHLVLPEFGHRGQERLASGSVLLVGLGGLGSPAALYLAAAGVGTLGLADHDAVELSNLQRQILHSSESVGRPKVDSAERRLSALNDDVELVAHRLTVDAGNVVDLVGRYDVVIDGSDNFVTRYLVNDAAVLLRKPLVHASVFRFEGQAMTVIPGSNCYRCLHPQPPPPGVAPSCEEGGVLGVVPGLMGVIQATEAIKLLAGIGETLSGRLLLVDLLRFRFQTMKVHRNRECAVCGDEPTIRTIEPLSWSCEPSTPSMPSRISPAELSRRLAAGGSLQLIDVREEGEAAVSMIEGSRLIPLGQLKGQLDSLDRDTETILYCRSGVRSLTAARLLRDHGFTRVTDLQGGMKQWAREIEPHKPVA